MTLAKADDPFQPSDEATEWQTRAEVCNALLGGTVGMRKEGEKFLPKEPMEDTEAYNARLNKTVLFPAYEKALNTMVGKPFDEEITLGDDVPQPIKDACENIDRAGRDLDVFAMDAFGQSLNDGMGWLVVDCTNSLAIAKRLGKKALDLKDERDYKVGPYLIHVPLSNFLGQRFETVDGVKKRVMFRYSECVKVADGAFGEKTVKRVRVLEPGKVSVYEKNAKGEPVLIPELSGPVTLGEMPVVAIPLGRDGFPPLENLAWLNVCHWQSQSDQRHILHTSRVPILFAKKLTATDGTPVAVGPNRLIRGDAESDLKWVELQGRSIEAGRQDLMDIEDAMRRVAGELLTAKVQKTATETEQEVGEGESQLRHWVHIFEDCLEEAFRLMAAWIKQPNGGGLTIATNWSDAEMSADMMNALAGLNQAGLISKDSAIQKLRDGRIIPGDRTVDEEKQLIANEAPTLDLTPPNPVPALDRMKARLADSTVK